LCRWVGGVSFRARFSRLFELLVFKEEQVGELKLLFHNVILQVDKDNRWLWNLETSHVFTVCSVYNFLTIQPHTLPSVVVSSLWNKDVPLKVVLFVWCLFRDRLPTKDNLIRRCVIDHESRLCVGGCGYEETSSRLFLHCNIFGSIWHFIYRWMRISLVNLMVVPDHFNQFTSGGVGAKARQSILQILWFATMWKIWKERNNRLFKGKECTIMHVVDRIKSLAFMWLKTKFASLSFNLHDWWQSSFTILGIG